MALWLYCGHKTCIYIDGSIADKTPAQIYACVGTRDAQRCLSYKISFYKFVQRIQNSHPICLKSPKNVEVLNRRSGCEACYMYIQMAPDDHCAVFDFCSFPCWNSAILFAKKRKTCC